MPDAHRSAFASDNTAGICPTAWEAMAQANAGYAPGYGNDEWTRRAADAIRELFETDCEVYFCFNGTAANSMAIAHLCKSFNSTICHEVAHVETDECGGPEFFCHGTKLLLAGGDMGRLDPAAVQAIIDKRSDIHYPKPRVLSLTQSTELGTVYSLDQLAALAEVARRNGLHVHMDGARFANAVASLDVPPAEVSWKLGVDVLCFGGTKNGMPVGEAVVFFNRELATEFDYRCKQAGQLASKMRYLAAPWVTMLQSGAWLENARRANSAARQLAERVCRFPGIRPKFPVQANAVFLDFPEQWAAALRARGWLFYTFIGGGARLMCSWATTQQDIDLFVKDLEEVTKQ